MHPARLAAFALTLLVPTLGAQQVADTLFRPALAAPTYPRGAGPRVCVDEAHANTHTLSGGYRAFGRFLADDGWRPAPFTTPLSGEALAACVILVIVNARGRPGDTAAFTSEEVGTVEAWVVGGGALLLIADHMPLAGPAKTLAARFGAEFSDGFAVAPFHGFADLDRALGEPTIFRRRDATLAPHRITLGIDSVRSFMGQAFRLPPGAGAILRLPPGFVSLFPDQPWHFTPETRQVDVGGWSQGAVLTVGRGRVALFGEAAMFTAQLVGPGRFPAGMNAAGAEQNPLLLRRVMRWLAGGLT
jgi:hypothetical protein